MRLSLLHEEMTLREYLGSGIPVLVVVAVPTGGEIPSDSFWHSRPSTANDANSRTATGTRATRVLNAGPGPPDARCRHPWGPPPRSARLRPMRRSRHHYRESDLWRARIQWPASCGWVDLQLATVSATCGPGADRSCSVEPMETQVMSFLRRLSSRLARMSDHLQ